MEQAYDEVLSPLTRSEIDHISELAVDNGLEATT
jgi:hypothetical protein